jgi:hypothetical protein
MTNVQSPGSHSSKGSSSLDQDYMPSTTMPEILTNYINNNYGNNYYVADGENNSSGSNDELGLDDIDEIDTNNMEIYNGAPIKKDRAGDLKQETDESETVKFLQAQPTTAGKSLLIPSKSISNSTTEEIDADLMMNALSDQAGTSSSIQTPNMDQLVAQNTMYDETSQVNGITLEAFRKYKNLFIFSASS